MLRKFLSLVLCVLAVSQAGHAQISDGKVLLEKAMKEVQKLKSLGLALTISPDGSVVKEPSANKMGVQIALEGKANACVKIKMGKQEVEMYENGVERSFFYVQKDWLKEAKSGPRESLIAGMVGEPLSKTTKWLAAFLTGNTKMPSEAKQVVYIGEEVVNGFDAEHLFLEYPDYNVDIFLRKDVGVPVNITFTLQKFSTAAPEELGGRKGGKVVMTFQSWQPNFNVAPEAFAYQKPVEEKTEEEEEPEVDMQKNKGASLPPISIPLLEGGTFDLASYRGKKAVLLDFWATWCAPCKMSLPILESLNNSMSLRHVEIVAISVDEDIEMAKDFVAENKLGLVFAHDEGGAASAAFNAYNIPTMVAISKEGKVVAYEQGYSDDYEERVRSILEKLDKLEP